MLDVEIEAQVPYLINELKSLIRHGSLASYMGESLGGLLHYRLVEWPRGDQTEFSRQFPVIDLFQSVSGGWGLPPEWLRHAAGVYERTSGEVVPENVAKTLTEEEHLATYGLWLIETGMSQERPTGVEWGDRLVRTRESVHRHRANCIMLAYQALTYAQKLKLRVQLSPEEMAKAIRVAAAKKAADDRHGKPGGTRSKRDQILQRWMSGKYSSRDHCAEQECAAIGISFSTARKSLRNAPNPPAPWPMRAPAS